MAYGVKYQLIFSDVLGFGKKVEILKKDYTGDILPMIGGAEPVKINWKTKDDFYTPLLGSQCTLNLMVTDDVQYDDFYKFDEREYQIKVSYSKSIPESYVDRVVLDGGYYESLDCISNAISQFYTDSTYYNYRVNNDGGIVESLNCVKQAISDNTYHIWSDYWIGYLVVDRYKETLNSFPYSISLNAFDGLGTLNNYEAPLSADDDQDSGNTTSDISRILLILQNLELNLDVVFINDLTYQQTVSTTLKFPNTTTFPNYLFELKNGFDTYNAKEQLTLLLTMYNMRIYQSYGKWFIVENSNVFDNYVKNQIIDKNENLEPPSNIRNLITNRLKGIENEFLSIEKFNYLGTVQSLGNLSVLKIAPKELKPIKSDLIKEYLQPLIEVERGLSTNQFEKTFWNNNAGFEYGDFNWNIDFFGGGLGYQAEVVENEISLKGTKSIKLTPYTLGANIKCFTTERIPATDQINGGTLSYIKFTFSAFVEATDDLSDTYIQFKIKNYDGLNTAYWNDTTNEWTSTDTLNKIYITEFNTWRTVTKNLKEGNAYAPNPINGKLEIEIWNTRTGTPGNYINTYYDNVGLFQDGAEFVTNFVLQGIIQKNISGTRTIKTSRLLDSNYTSKKSYNTILFPTESTSMQKLWYRSRDYNVITGNTTNYSTVTDIANQNIMNDFRDFCTRYEGSFRCLSPTPMAPHNKIWFNWKGILEDQQSSILDGLVYNVKSNNYKVIAHVPNDDNDLSIKTRITE